MSAACPLRSWIVAGGAALVAAGAAAQVAEIVVAPDVALVLPGWPEPVLDRDALRQRADGTGASLFDLGPIPDGVGLAALDIGADGTRYFVLDGWAELPGIGLAGPGHIVYRSGSGFSGKMNLPLDHGAPPEGVGIDALEVLESLEILLSFDGTVELPDGSIAEDEDVVRLGPGGYSMALDLTGVVDDGLDLDALDVSPGAGNWWISFDGSGRVGGVDFDDEDLLGGFAETWWLGYDASSVAPEWSAVDLAAFATLEAPIFCDGFESGDTEEWSATTPRDEGRSR